MSLKVVPVVLAISARFAQPGVLAAFDAVLEDGGVVGGGGPGEVDLGGAGGGHAEPGGRGRGLRVGLRGRGGAGPVPEYGPRLVAGVLGAHPVAVAGGGRASGVVEGGAAGGRDLGEGVAAGPWQRSMRYWRTPSRRWRGPQERSIWVEPTRARGEGAGSASAVA